MTLIILPPWHNNFKYFAEILLYFSILLCEWDYPLLYLITLNSYEQLFSMSIDAFLEFHPYIHLSINFVSLISSSVLVLHFPFL